jgi:hypothetical protein
MWTVTNLRIPPAFRFPDTPFEQRPCEATRSGRPVNPKHALLLAHWLGKSIQKFFFERSSLRSFSSVRR